MVRVSGGVDIYIANLSSNRRSEFLYFWREPSNEVNGGQPGVDKGLEALFYNL